MVQDASLFRLYLMRGLYFMNFVLLGSSVWPTLIHGAGSWDLVKGAAFCLWAALSLLSGLGLRYPLQMLPLLLFQLTYKSVWLLIVALPQWSAVRSDGLTKAMLVGALLDVLIIPWPYVAANYILKRGERWHSR